MFTDYNSDCFILLKYGKLDIFETSTTVNFCTHICTFIQHKPLVYYKFMQNKASLIINANRFVQNHICAYKGKFKNG